MKKKYIQDTYLSQMSSTNDKRDFALNQQSKVNHKYINQIKYHK